MRAGMKRRLSVVVALLLGALLVAGPAFAQDAGGAPPVHDGWDYKGVIALILGAPAIVFTVVFLWFHSGRERGTYKQPH
jgi:hypothetical protein